MIPNDKTFQAYFQSLTPKQRQAIPLLAAGESGKAVARAINCNPATVSQWLNHDSGFNQALRVFSQISIYKAQLQLDSLAADAITELRDLILNARSEQVRLRAIELVMNAVGLAGKEKGQTHQEMLQSTLLVGGTNGYDLNRLVEVLGD